MFEGLTCANDEKIEYTYDDIVEYMHEYYPDDHPRIPLVPRHTYPITESIPHTRSLDYHTLKRFNCNRGDKIEPVIMRGAWKVIARSYEPRKALNDEVRKRFLRFYKATILSYKDAEKWKDKIDKLMLKNVPKRDVYRQTNHEGMYTNQRFLYNSNDCNCVVLGIPYYFISKDQLQVIKSIYRHVKKLTKLVNPNEEIGKWQQLIQQAI